MLTMRLATLPVSTLSFKKKNLFHMLIHMSVCVVCMRHMYAPPTVRMWRSDDNLWKSCLSLHHVGPRDQNRVLKL